MIGRPISEEGIGTGLKELYPRTCREAVRELASFLPPTPCRKLTATWGQLMGQSMSKQLLGTPHHDGAQMDRVVLRGKGKEAGSMLG
jgi:hypothetical protein